jgi:hypothetical protein
VNHKPRTRAQKRLGRQYRILDAIEMRYQTILAKDAATSMRVGRKDKRTITLPACQGDDHLVLWKSTQTMSTIHRLDR